MTITLTGIEGEMIITLTGMMGCGKSSVGRELSGLLSLPFVDLDEYIESREGRSIRDIFEDEGEAAFRKMELESLKEILAQDNIILSLGGGTITTPECADLVSARTFCIYLKASPATLLAHLEHESAGRPMLNPTDAGTSTGNTGTSTGNAETVTLQNSNPSSSKNTPSISLKDAKQQLQRRITALLTQRTPIYEATARHIVSTDGLSIPQIAAAISKLPNKYVTNHRMNHSQLTEQNSHN